MYLVQITQCPKVILNCYILLLIATQPGVFDQVIINDNLDEAYEAFCKYIEEVYKKS